MVHVYRQKNDIKAGEFTRNKVGMILLEWNIIITFLLHYSTVLWTGAENKTKLCAFVSLTLGPSISECISSLFTGHLYIHHPVLIHMLKK